MEKQLQQRRVTLPRIVSACVKKNSIPTVDPKDNPIIKPYVAGDLEIINNRSCPPHRSWRYAEIREGCLLLYKMEDGRKVFDFRILLRNLNLRIDPNCLYRFSLLRRGDQLPVATFQVPDGQDSSRWLKNLAIQIIINTPLNAVKFLDVLDILEEFKKQKQSLQQSSNNELKSRLYDDCSTLEKTKQHDNDDDDRNDRTIKKNIDEFDCNRSKISSLQPQQQQEEPDLTRYLAVRKRSGFCINNGTTRGDLSLDIQQQLLLPDVVNDAVLTANPIIPYYADSSAVDGTTTAVEQPDSIQRRNRSGDYVDCRQHVLADLLARCQTNDRFVSVSEKRLLFESLSRFSFSADNLVRRNGQNERTCSTMAAPKYHSLHDLNSSSTTGGRITTSVKRMCRYFESSSWITERAA